MPLRYLDLGGGLGIDYTGEKTASANSINYSLREYCLNIIETVKDMMDSNGVDHPVIITESGRACVAQSSLLIFNVLEATHYDSAQPVTAAENDSPLLAKMLEIENYLTPDRLQECWNDLHLQIIWYGREYCPARGWDLEKDIITKKIGRKSVLNEYYKKKKN